MYHSRIVLSVGGSVWYMIRNLLCTVTIDSVLVNSKTQNAFLFTVNAIFLYDYPLAVEPGSTPRSLVQKKTWRDSLPIDMLISAVSVLVVAQSSSDSRRDLRITLYSVLGLNIQDGEMTIFCEFKCHTPLLKPYRLGFQILFSPKI